MKGSLGFYFLSPRFPCSSTNIIKARALDWEKYAWHVGSSSYINFWVNEWINEFFCLFVSFFLPILSSWTNMPSPASYVLLFYSISCHLNKAYILEQLDTDLFTLTILWLGFRLFLNRVFCSTPDRRWEKASHTEE